jgi:hypothetical protein
MRESTPFLPAREEVRARYAVTLLADACPTERGVVHREAGAEHLLEWGQVRRAVAAEVGEPQGVRTTVFDLVVTAGKAYRAWRFDAEPGEPAARVAGAISRGLPPERLGSSIKSLAAGGVAVDWHPDLASFEEATLVALVRDGV